MRSLDEEQAARALLCPVAPADIVGGNRPRIGDGDPPQLVPGHRSAEARLAAQHGQ